MAQAAARITPQEVTNLYGFLDTIEAGEDPAEFADHDHRFHAEIARVGGSPSTQALLTVFRSRSRHHRVFALPDGPEFERAGDEDHRAIVAALANRDPAAAASAAAAHIARGERRLGATRPPVTEDAVDGAPAPEEGPLPG
ncbi:FadR/GntR family transcriptional regulator [Streptomyces sp. NPDC006477]|uniref:FadR/GntR family transcriptional regulator n=1 Tax=Streptomyces sp. NPDC006477 TaxID=3364747 RepID=UPI00367BC0D7